MSPECSFERNSQDIFLLFRIANLLGSIRIYSSLFLFIVILMFMAFLKIKGEGGRSKDLCPGGGLMESH